jgi:hypothetical protein
VTEHEERKYRTKEETTRQKVIQLDRQAEADRMGGDDGKDATAAKARKKEQRARCTLYDEWLPQFQNDASDKKQAFFTYLSSNFEDYGALNKLSQQRSKDSKKANKLYRHIAKETHPDRLPDNCNSEELAAMMTAIIGKACV